MSKCIGIDLGTTNSVVAVMEGDTPKLITNEEGNRTTPSVVAYQKDGEILVGQIARRQAITNPENTVYSIKRFMGRKFGEVGEEIGLVPYEVFQASNGDAHVKVLDKTLTPPEISAKILQKLKRAAEAYLGSEVKEAVITVPAYFNDSQRQATKDAGQIAGLEVKRIVNEPTAAALAYGLERKKDQIIAVYDFGGGTFDISILEVGESVVEVISTNGDTHLGGDNIDQRIIDYLVTEFKRDQGIDVSGDKMVIQRLKEAAEKAKIELSSALETDINLPFLTADQSGPKHMNLKLTRAKLESLCEDLIMRTFDPLTKALADAKKKPGDIDEIVMVGGSTRIPRVQEEVKKYFGKDPNRTVNPDEVVAIGAALQAGVLSGDVKDLLLLDVTPLSLGIETLGGVMTRLIERNTTIPTRKSEIFSTASDGQTSVDVHVLQGEREMAAGNRTLGKFMLDGIPPSPRGMPQIEVTFDIDANGIVNVSAKDKATGREQHITITASSGMSKDEIDQKVNEAKSHAEEDKKRREEVETRNRGDQLAYQTEKTLGEYKDKLPADVVSEIESKLQVLKDALSSGQTEGIGKASDDLMAASQKMGEALYKDMAGAPGAPGSTPPPPDGGNTSSTADPSQADGDVIDAEYKEAKE